MGKLGRLGNQLFQYAATVGLATMNGYQVGMPKLQDRQWHSQKCLLDEFQVSYKDIDDNKFNFYYQQDHNKLDHDFFKLKDFTSIWGFFQSLWYFQHRRRILKFQCKPKQKYYDTAKFILDSLKDQHRKRIISIHVRRGDFSDDTNPLYNKYYYRDGLFWSYVKKAMSMFDKDDRFLLFTGGSRNGQGTATDDMQWCYQNIKDDRIIRLDYDNNALVDYRMISLCDGNILAPATTYGWWAAYVGDDGNKQVVAPYNFNLYQLPPHKQKFYPNNWVCI